MEFFTLFIFFNVLLSQNEELKFWNTFWTKNTKPFMNILTNRKIAILTDNGFEQIELTSPKSALEEAGATVHIISQQDVVKGWDHDHWDLEINADVSLSNANPEDYDALMIPGGVMNPDKMRTEKAYVDFAQHFLETGKPIAAICHAPQLLIETGMLAERNMTSYPSLKTDLKNAGVIWEDKEVVTDRGLVTSRTPEDLPAFNKKMIEEFAEGQHLTESSFMKRTSTMG